ncbi:hypothetical protein HfxHF1_205 [Halophage HF1]|uniref:Uncharacterized protein n=2 Tax=Haloferacalesvirus TaxID=2843389 RepID=A0A6B9PFD1_9CAUD|nr:hypothetical protein HrrHF2_205 [Halorubrum phage HF2]YP_009725284.1 hypothetical protein HfxHF1_205 [Halophage HF1]QHD55905.1 hypothetical protein HrrHF2_205 [Halorubrum phage HF2]QHD55926.1 hypothetical protein HfxHF1_205 [Halophage HF1]QIR31127.1 hypothetical protein HrrHc2_455 [Halorubrum virus Hardycor2]
MSTFPPRNQQSIRKDLYSVTEEGKTSFRSISTINRVILYFGKVVALSNHVTNEDGQL